MTDHTERKEPVDVNGLVERLRHMLDRWTARFSANEQATINEAADALASRDAENAELTKDRDYYAERYADRCGQLIVRDATIAAQELVIGEREEALRETWLILGDIRHDYEVRTKNAKEHIARQQSLGVDNGEG